MHVCALQLQTVLLMPLRSSVLGHSKCTASSAEGENSDLVPVLPSSSSRWQVRAEVAAAPGGGFLIALPFSSVHPDAPPLPLTALICCAECTRLALLVTPHLVWQKHNGPMAVVCSVQPLLF